METTDLSQREFPDLRERSQGRSSLDMKKIIKLTVCALALSAMGAYAEDKKGEEVSVTELPPAVTQSVHEKWTDAHISSAYRMMKDNETCYKVNVMKDGEAHVAYVTPDGKMMESKKTDKN